jgi:uncharacterized cupin superfamily protein
VVRGKELAMPGFTIVHLSDFERPFPNWALARRSLGLQSFGMNVVELPPGETIPEHDETATDQEEVFIVLSGEATMVIDGRDHPAPAGTFVRLDPAPRRTVVNRSAADVTVLIVSAPRTSGHTPPEWA